MILHRDGPRQLSGADGLKLLGLSRRIFIGFGRADKMIGCKRFSCFNCRANDADDVMVSAPEIKRTALCIEEELFAYYGEVNTKYKHKFRTMITHLKDPKNTVRDLQ